MPWRVALTHSPESRLLTTDPSVAIRDHQRESASRPSPRRLASATTGFSHSIAVATRRTRTFADFRRSSLISSRARHRSRENEEHPVVTNPRSIGENPRRGRLFAVGLGARLLHRQMQIPRCAGDDGEGMPSPERVAPRSLRLRRCIVVYQRRGLRAHQRHELDAGGGVPAPRRPRRAAARQHRAAQLPAAHGGLHPPRARRRRGRRAARRPGVSRSWPTASRRTSASSRDRSRCASRRTSPSCATSSTAWRTAASGAS